MNAEFRQKMPRDLHLEVKKKAASLGMSVNSYINHVLASKGLEDRVTDLEKRILELEKKNQKNKK